MHVTPLPDAPAQLRVVSVPSGHPYVQHLSAPRADAQSRAARDGVVRLPDFPPAGAAPGQWWPPVVFDAAWIHGHASSFDLFHLHFGVESFSIAHVEAVVAALRALHKPFVHTVHDLTNPQLVDQAPHLAQLDVIVPAADALITLTDGAAAAVASRWGRRPVTIPHPNVFPLDDDAPIGAASGPFVVGMHLRDLRPNIDAVTATETLVAAVGRLRDRGLDVVGRIHVNDRVRDEATRDRVVAVVVGGSGVELVQVPRLSDADLAASIADLDVAVLPYRHGTHSGWVELCFDLGVPVVGPHVGHAGEQHPEAFRAFDRGSAESLAAAFADTVQVDAARPGSPERVARIARRRAMRREQRTAIDRAHRAVYETATAATTTAATTTPVATVGA
ncbi:hypothetical protein [Curtobacterium sp. RRHDQ10]|uniref:hypothetical protein n=1 Tax=Curtobacterium phyllosphaerae TaxID=3413379 RepID=UPI003BF25605